MLLLFILIRGQRMVSEFADRLLDWVHQGFSMPMKAIFKNWTKFFATLGEESLNSVKLSSCHFH